MIGPVGGSDLGFLAGGSILAVLCQQAWQRFFTAEGKGNDALVTQLTERITALEARQTKQEADLDEERKLRRLAEDRVHALEMDNLMLRAELRRHNIDVSATLLPDYGLRSAGQG